MAATTGWSKYQTSGDTYGKTGATATTLGSTFDFRKATPTTTAPPKQGLAASIQQAATSYAKPAATTPTSSTGLLSQEAIKKEQDAYIAKTKAGGQWSIADFGKQLQKWNTMGSTTLGTTK